MRGRKLQRARTQLLSDSPLCVHCYAKGVIQPATERDHVTPLAMGGTDDPANTQGLCVACHQIKTKDDLRRIAEWKASGSPLPKRTDDHDPVFA